MNGAVSPLIIRITKSLISKHTLTININEKTTTKEFEAWSDIANVTITGDFKEGGTITFESSAVTATGVVGDGKIAITISADGVALQDVTLTGTYTENRYDEVTVNLTDPNGIASTEGYINVTKPEANKWDGLGINVAHDKDASIKIYIVDDKGNERYVLLTTDMDSFVTNIDGNDYIFYLDGGDGNIIITPSLPTSIKSMKITYTSPPPVMSEVANSN